MQVDPAICHVRSWPIATEIHVAWHVGDQGKSGLVVLNVSFVARDPEQTLAPFRAPSQLPTTVAGNRALRSLHRAGGWPHRAVRARSQARLARRRLILGGRGRHQFLLHRDRDRQSRP